MQPTSRNAIVTSGTGRGTSGPFCHEKIFHLRQSHLRAAKVVHCGSRHRLGFERQPAEDDIDVDARFGVTKKRYPCAAGKLEGVRRSYRLDLAPESSFQSAHCSDSRRPEVAPAACHSRRGWPGVRHEPMHGRTRLRKDAKPAPDAALAAGDVFVLRPAPGSEAAIRSGRHGCDRLLPGIHALRASYRGSMLVR